jgi:hypothetical protein
MARSHLLAMAYAIFGRAELIIMGVPYGDTNRLLFGIRDPPSAIMIIEVVALAHTGRGER